MVGIDIELLIKNIPGVSDCCVVDKRNGAAQSKIVLFYVPTDTEVAEDVEHAIKKSLPNPQLIDYFVPVTCIPADKNGHPDVQALLKLGVFDQTCLEQNLTQFLSQQNPHDAISVMIPSQFSAPPLYLDELNQYQTKLVDQSRSHIANTPSKSTLDAKKAFSDGGKLNIPDNAPNVLVDCLLRAADAVKPEAIITVNNRCETRFNYSQLLTKSSCVLSGLRAKQLNVGTPIVFQFRDNAEFLTGFWGCLLGGYVPVPMAVAADYQADVASIENIQRVCAMLGDAPILTSSSMVNEIRQMPWPDGQSPLVVLDLGQLQLADADNDYHVASPDDITLIMLTSGTTGASKGVPLSHKNLICRSIASVQVNQFSRQTVSLNWMPLDHVAGIIYFHLRDVYLGCQQIHVAASDILESPLVWLDLLHQYRATVTFAPNFAFGLIAGLSEQIKQQSWDLSALKLVLNGGEAVVASTARQFLKMLARFGLSKFAMCPAWGMSETSSGITYARDFALDNTSDTDSHVAVGPPIPGDFMRITDPNNQILMEGEVGRLQVKGDTVFSGYFNNPEENAEAFTDDGWFNTGDLGILMDGKLTITGREKDVIIVNGVNYSGASIESLVEDIERITRSYVAACAVSDPRQGGRECLALFFVCDSPQPSAELLRKIKGQVTSKAGVSPEYLVPLQIDDIPKTSIGKIQRTKLKIKFEKGEFSEQVKQTDLLLGNRCMPAWFFKPIWQAYQPHVQANISGHRVLMLVADLGIGKRLSEQLQQRDLNVTLVLLCDQFSLSDPSALRVRSNHRSDYQALFEYIALKGDSIDHAMIACNQTATMDNSVEQPSGFWECAISACAQGLISNKNFRTQTLSILTDRVQSVDHQQIIAQQLAGIPAVVKTLKQELAQLNYQLIDLDFNEETMAENLYSELTLIQHEKDIAWRNNQRFRHVLQLSQPQPIHHDPLNPSCPAGFVISGGLGGIGRLISRTLLQSDHSRLLILGSKTLKTIEAEYAQLDAFLQSSPRVDYVSVDVADQEAVLDAVNKWNEQTGAPLTGIFHLAGQYRELPLEQETAESLLQLSRSKVQGALSLSKVIEQHANAYLVNFSSTAGIFGGALIGAYAAACSALDGISQNIRARGFKCFSINWSSWRATGMSEGNTAIDALRTRGILELDVEAALTSLRLILGQSQPCQIAVGLDPANSVIRQACEQGENLRQPCIFVENTLAKDVQAIEFNDAFGLANNAYVYTVEHMPRLENGDVDKSALDIIAAQGNVRVVAAKTATEQRLVQIWQEILKIETISTDWNFFDVGGQSILATKLIARVRQEFAVEWTLKDIFSAPTCIQQALVIDQQLANVETRPQSNDSVIPILSRDEPLPLSSAQQRLWFIDQLDIPSSAYNVTACIRFSQPPDRLKLANCLNQIIARQESLRVRFPSVKGIPTQIVSSESQVGIRCVKVHNQTDLDHTLIAEGQYHFNLSEGPLLRAALIEDHLGRYALALTLHHIISDGWSMRVLFEQFETLYVGDTLDECHPNTVQYVDYAAWQQSRIDTGKYDNQLAFWREQLHGGLAGFDIPTDYPRPLVQTYSGSRFTQNIPPLLAGQLREQAANTNVTLFVLLLSGFKALLSRYAQKQDVMIGTVVANRDYAEIKDLVGFFVNPVVLRSNVDPNISFAALVEQVNQNTLDAVANHNLPFEYLVEQLAPPRDTSRSPLFQIAFDLRDPDLTTSRSGDLEFSVMEADLGTAKYDLHLTLEERGPEILAFWEFNTDLFTPQRISNMAANFQRLLECAMTAPQTLITDLEVLAPQEISHQESYNQTSAPFNADVCMHHLFEAAAKQYPERDAVVFGDQRISYAALNAKANRLARLLVDKGAQPDSLIALCLDRSIDAMVSILAVLKSGAAYLALDPTYPRRRLAYMLKDAEAQILLTSESIAADLKPANIELIYIEQTASTTAHYAQHNLDVEVRPNNLAYAIYTSGSTGQPKGVLLEHKGWCNVAQAQIDSFGLQQGMRILQFASMSFDASAFEFAMAWGSGGTLFMGDKQTLLPGLSLANFLGKHQVQVVTLPPTALSALADIQLPDLTVVTVAGEACPASLVKKWAGNTRRFFNLYGPTETTIWASYAECFVQDEGSPVIGYPVANTQLYVVDEWLNRLPIGMPGELCIAGVGVARGYHGKPELTAQKFVKDPFSRDPNARLYRSGDLVRYRNDGRLEFLGRIDHQVKVRGYRVELGEIEEQLQKYPGIKESVVTAHQNKSAETQLIAYVGAQQVTQIDIQSIRAHLRSTLTDYMVPAHIFVLDSLPLSLNGKVDRNALPAPESLLNKQVSIQTADSDMERIVIDIWKQALDTDSIDVTANFFDIGGHSLKMAQVQTLLSSELKREVSLVDLFQHTSVKALARYLESSSDSAIAGQVTNAEPLDRNQHVLLAKVSGRERMAKMATIKRRQGR
ncbi:amino acid adenylation domain-containing protein [Aliiglaciecola litoralis]|uniref:Carrier domain-containing protein n=1 Tax=Aliiglaciecola litoralis TaxID=582857 RepID=A0ABN1LJ85_9ALTE